MNGQEMEKAIEEIWSLFRDTDRMFKETRLQFQETRLQFEETDRRFKETDRKFQDTDRKFQDTDRKFQDTDRKFQDTDRKFNRTDEKLRDLEGLFVGQWGKLMESLGKGSAVKPFREWGIDVHMISQRAASHREGRSMEINLLMANDDQVVVVEVKTTLKVEHVRELLEDLKAFTRFFKRFRGCRVYGAVAALRMEEEADKYAYRHGLFVVKAGADGLAKILNDHRFRPADFGK